MSEVLTLGSVAMPLQVNLSAGSDFYCVIDTSIPFEPGDSLTLAFGVPVSTTWTATIVDARATFDVDKTIADTITDGTVVQLLHTTTSGRDQVWAKGVVRRG